MTIKRTQTDICINCNADICEMCPYFIQNIGAGHKEINESDCIYQVYAEYFKEEINLEGMW